MNDTPELRLRARHRLCQPCTGHGSMAGEPHCYHCWEPWPCEVIMGLDALLPSDVESLRLSIESVIGHAERKDAEIRALQGENDRLREQITALEKTLKVTQSDKRQILKRETRLREQADALAEALGGLLSSVRNQPWDVGIWCGKADAALRAYRAGEGEEQ